MMVITSVERKRKAKGMLSVYIDGKYGFSLREEDFIALSLYELQEITEEKLAYIKETVNFRAAKLAAVKFLSLKVRCEKEVRDKLGSEGFEDCVIEKVIEELKSLGYINDKIYAQKFIFDRNKLKPISKKLLKLELQKRGISDDISDEVLSDLEIDDFTVAENLVRRKFGKYDIHDETIVKKIYSFLHHRGYSYSLIDDLVGKLTHS
ncbi:MAG: regulatory protein RecX [Clostridiales bacterium]|nr:recombination regulator RecX [Eubacteriales bacterium]MDH7565073.1 regulatory protein RecX [Clostridiales bacterium]